MIHVYNFEIFKLTFFKNIRFLFANQIILLTLIDSILFQVRASVSTSRQSRPILSFAALQPVRSLKPRWDQTAS